MAYLGFFAGLGLAYLGVWVWSRSKPLGGLIWVVGVVVFVVSLIEGINSGDISEDFFRNRP